MCRVFSVLLRNRWWLYGSCKPWVAKPYYYFLVSEAHSFLWCWGFRVLGRADQQSLASKQGCQSSFGIGPCMSASVEMIAGRGLAGLEWQKRVSEGRAGS